MQRENRLKFFDRDCASVHSRLELMARGLLFINFNLPSRPCSFDAENRECDRRRNGIDIRDLKTGGEK